MIGKFFATQSSLKAAGAMRLGNYAFQAMLMLVLTPFIIGHVGKSGFGIWTAVSALTGYYGLVNLGVGSALVRHLARHAARKEEEGMSRVLGTGLAFFTVTGIVVGVGGFFASDWLAGLFDQARENQETFGALLGLVSIALAADFIGVSFSSVLNAHEEYLTQTLMESARMVLRAVLIFALLTTGFGLVGLGITVLVISFLMLATNVILVFRGKYPLKVSVFNARWGTLKTLLTYGSSTALMNVVSLTRTKAGHLILAGAASFASVASFGVASNLVMQYQGLIFSFNSALTARFSRLDAVSDERGIRALFQKTLFSNAFLAFGAGLIIFVFGRPFVIWWIGEDFLDAVPALHVLTIGYAAALSQTSGWNLMFGLDRHHKMAYVSIAEAAALIVLALYLVIDYGILGIALATTMTMIVTKSVIQPVYIIRLLGMPITDYLRPIVAPLSVAVPIGIGGYFFAGAIPELSSSLLLIAGVVAMVASVYVIGVYLLYRGAAFFVAPKVLERFVRRAQRNS